jgi:hypothetical protein
VRRLDRGSFELFIETEEQRDLVEKADRLANTFSKRAKKYDFVTIPERFGGKGISLTTFLLLMERLGGRRLSAYLPKSDTGWCLNK